MARLEEAAKPFHLRIEGPMDVEDREKQMRALAAITKELDDRGINVEIVAGPNGATLLRTSSTLPTTKRVTWFR